MHKNLCLSVTYLQGAVPKWLGSGLQIRQHRFESDRRLQFLSTIVSDLNNQDITAFEAMEKAILCLATWPLRPAVTF